MHNEYHVPVLAEEVLRYLQPARDGIYVDGTLGGGGHTEYIARNMSAQSKIICFDLDNDGLRYAQQHLSDFGKQLTFIQDNFTNLRAQLKILNVNRIQGLLLDLGVSSHQLDQKNRGFSFQEDARIDMRMNTQQKLDGWTVVNTYEQERISEIMWKYGEERNSRKIARRIVEARKNTPIDSTRELARVIESAVGSRFLQKSLARVFQAIRIEVNGELENLRRVLRDSIDFLEKGGRIFVISYHSLEDRIVKQFFKEEAETFIPSKVKLLPDQPRQPRLSILTKKPVEAGKAEIERNSRARSAKLRAAERI